METGSIILVLSFAVPAIVILVILYFVRKGLKKDAKYAEELSKKISAARPATALILSASQGIISGDINRIIHLKLKISDGFVAPYEAKTTWFVNTLHFDKIREGNGIMVKVDAEDKSIIYPAESWGRFSSGYENL
ncbi:MAG TPA: hypothetical protein PKC91_00425 [Ignavibacteria bacterium]|nr:hypothetical protein [Ignavibacteria bacterium]